MRKLTHYLGLLFDCIFVIGTVLCIALGIADVEEYSYLFFIIVGCGIDIFRRFLKQQKREK